MRVETYRLEVLQAPGIYCWEAYTWTHPEKHNHWSYIVVMYTRSNRIRWRAISHFLDWQMGHVIAQISDVMEPFQRNFTFSPLWQKVWSISKFENKQICSFFGCGEEVHTELYFMLHPWGFHHCGWTAFLQQMWMSIYAVHVVKSWQIWAEISVSCRQREQVCGKWVWYGGRDETHSRDECVSDQFVMLLLKPHLNKGSNVTTDNYFTSMNWPWSCKKQNQPTGDSEQNPEGSTCSGEAHERDTSLHHTL